LTAIIVSPYTAAMDETQYRESRICRLLGNPVIYRLVVLLDDGGPMTPSHLAKLAGRSVQTVSGHLAKLRMADIAGMIRPGKKFAIGSSTAAKRARYLKALEKIVHASSQLA
jgi:DNA-binding transcriptional ArsR family regulator